MIATHIKSCELPSGFHIEKSFELPASTLAVVVNLDEVVVVQ
jgi:hypothetical protein